MHKADPKAHNSGMKCGDKSPFKQMFWYKKSLAQLQCISQEEKHIDMEESTQSGRNTSVSAASVLCCECVRRAPDSSHICQHTGGKALVQSSAGTQFWFNLLFSCNSACQAESHKYSQNPGLLQNFIYSDFSTRWKVWGGFSAASSHWNLLRNPQLSKKNNRMWGLKEKLYEHRSAIFICYL